jgi:hypothetical protein
VKGLWQVFSTGMAQKKNFGRTADQHYFWADDDEETY